MKQDHDNIELFILNQAIKNSNSEKDIKKIEDLNKEKELLIEELKKYN